MCPHHFIVILIDNPAVSSYWQQVKAEQYRDHHWSGHPKFQRRFTMAKTPGRGASDNRMGYDGWQR
jgi:hypothetical protein